MNGNHGNKALKTGEDRFPAQGTIRHDHGTELLRRQILGMNRTGGGHQRRRLGQAHQHTGKKGVSKFLSSRSGIQIRIERKRP